MIFLVYAASKPFLFFSYREPVTWAYIVDRDITFTLLVYNTLLITAASQAV